MRRLAVLFLLTGCSAAPAPDAGHGPAVDACASAVAAHVGKPVEAVAATWTGAAAAGGAVVTVTDALGGAGERTHTCEVGADGRVLAIRHPGA